MAMRHAGAGLVIALLCLSCGRSFTPQGSPPKPVPLAFDSSRWIEASDVQHDASLTRFRMLKSVKEDLTLGTRLGSVLSKLGLPFAIDSYPLKGSPKPPKIPTAAILTLHYPVFCDSETDYLILSFDANDRLVGLDEDVE